MKRSPSLDQLLAISFILVAIFLIFIFLLWKIPEWQLVSKASLSLKRSIELENEIRKTWAQIFGGAFILIGLFLTGLTVWSRLRTLEVIEEGQITERFTRAIDQIGSEKLEIRLGGIYALERIANDSEKDYWPIMEILTAYIRENAPLGKKDKEEQIPIEFRPPTKAESFVNKVTSVPKPPTDIQAVLDVIGRRNHAFRGNEEKSLILRKTSLQRANLEGGYLKGVNLYESNLFGALLAGANLQGALLARVNFYGAILARANLYGADLVLSNLDNVSLMRANLRKTNLRGANLQGANFYEADLQEAILSESNLKGARYLTIEQLSKVKTLDKAELDPPLMEQIQKDYPHLLKEPKVRIFFKKQFPYRS